MANLPEPFHVRSGKAWSVVRRLEFIEFRLYWEGTLNRAALTEKFGVSPAQTTIDIADYQKLAPGNCEYDTKAKTYLAGRPFKPIFNGCTSPRYLNELQSLGEKVVLPYDSWLGAIPAFETLPRVQSHVNPKILQSIVKAFIQESALLISYQTSSRSKPDNCWITPHALFEDGSRWYARAFCHQERAFRDFSLGRILKASALKEHVAPASLDREWVEQIELVFGLHSKLPAAQRAAVEIDYGMSEGSLVSSIRASLAPFLIRLLRADLDPKIVGPDQSPIVVKNRTDIESQLNALRAESKRRLFDLEAFEVSR